MKKLVIIYYHFSLGKKAFQFQKYGRTLILEPRTVHQIDDIEQGLFWEPLLWGSTGRMKEELPVRRQGLLAFSALSGLGDLGHPPFTSLGVSFFMDEEMGWNRLGTSASSQG